MIFPGEHVAIFGMTGSGKSTLTRSLSGAFPRKIIFDRLGEWTHANPQNIAHNFPQFSKLYRDYFDHPDFEIIVRPRAGSGPDELFALTNAVMELAYRAESHAEIPQGLALIFEEIWLYAPLHSTSPWMLEMLLTGRHPKISIIGNSQRPANVSKTLVSQARHVFIGQFYESNDRKYYRDFFGDQPWVENPPPRFEFIWFRADADPSARFSRVKL